MKIEVELKPELYEQFTLDIYSKTWIFEITKEYRYLYPKQTLDKFLFDGTQLYPHIDSVWINTDNKGKLDFYADSGKLSNLLEHVSTESVLKITQKLIINEN